MTYTVTVLPQKQRLTATAGENLLACLRRNGLAPDAPCGGNGSCGKCSVLLEGREVLACHRTVDRDLTVTVPKSPAPQILTAGSHISVPAECGPSLAFDIGTTTVAGALLDRGQLLATDSCLNPQCRYGADVISRIQSALKGGMDGMTRSVRKVLSGMSTVLCRQAGIDPEKIDTVCVVGNPAMQQLFLGIEPRNLAQLPFAPVLTAPEVSPAREILPVLKNARLLTVPDISGYVGADTVACLLSTGMADADELSLLVDIGTNAEIVLGNRDRMVACSAAAGPALEGANIRFGMRAASGAIDHAWVENGKIQCSIIGSGEATGICGSGIIDAVAAALKLGMLNRRGKILTGDTIPLTDRVYLTQEDIRQVQLAKGAVGAAIHLLAQQLEVRLEDVHRVYLAGAFGSFLNVEKACFMGLLPACLQEKTRATGNVALTGAMELACEEALFQKTGQILDRIQAVELGSLPAFRRCFAKQMEF